MKRILPAVLMTLALVYTTACTKSRTTTPENPGFCLTVYPPLPDSVSFGRAHGFCDANCARFFLMINAGPDSGRLYPDSMNRYTGTAVFGSTPLSAADYELALDLAKDLRTLPGVCCTTDTTFGAPDSHDQGGLYISFKMDKVRYNWVVDMDTIQQPAHLRAYFKKVNSVIDELP
jgi:hypothetical protein